MISRYQKYKESYLAYRLKNKQKAYPDSVKAWKKANPERVRELNQASYRKLKSAKKCKEQASSKMKMCACGNVAFKLTSSGYVCERCSKIERKNRKYEAIEARIRRVDTKEAFFETNGGHSHAKLPYWNYDCYCATKCE